MKEEEGKKGGRGGGRGRGADGLAGGRVGRLEGVYHLFWLAGVYLDVLPLVCSWLLLVVVCCGCWLLL